MAWKWKKLDQEGRPPLDPPMFMVVYYEHRVVCTHWNHLLWLYWFGDFDHPDESPGAIHPRHGVVHGGGFPQHHVSLIRRAHPNLQTAKNMLYLESIRVHASSLPPIKRMFSQASVCPQGGAGVGNTKCIKGKVTWYGIPWKGQVGYPSPDIRSGGPPASDIWWLSLETCSNLFTWTPSPEQHLVVATEYEGCTVSRWVVCILLEWFLVNEFEHSGGGVFIIVRFCVSWVMVTCDTPLLWTDGLKKLPSRNSN